ncbi:MAG: hypothetical protein ACI4MJ_09570 [Aristaeellaceae bacterium]
MKKIVCLVLAMLLFATTAMATPSKTVVDLNDAETSVPGATMAASQDAAAAATAQNEYSKLLNATTPETYFGTVAGEGGEVVDVRELLGAEAGDTLNVHEFGPVAASGFTMEDDKATVTLSFATPYDTDVVVMIGLVAEDGTVAWNAFKGEAVNGSIKVEFPAEILVAIQNGTALMAIVSK